MICMLDHDAICAAVAEACAMHPECAGPDGSSWPRPPTFALAPEARDRIGEALLNHSNVSNLFGFLLPIGDGGAQIFDLERIASWLVWEAKKRCVSDVVTDFDYFLKHREVEGLRIYLLHGLRTETRIPLGGSLWLEPFTSLPDSWQKRLFSRRQEFKVVGTDRLGDPVALVARFPVLPGLTDRQDRAAFEKHACDSANRSALMQDIPYLFTLLDNSAPVVSGIWSQITGRGVPFLRSDEYAMGVEDLGEMAFLPPTKLEPTEVQALVSDYMALSEKARARLKIPLRQLNRSKRQFTDEAAAIDLRTALEALLLPDDKQEITFKVSLFGAWMLGRDYEERKRAFYRLKKAYALGSQAVHSGRFRQANVRYHIWEVQSDVSLIIRKMIADGDEVELLDLVLGKI